MVTSSMGSERTRLWERVSAVAFANKRITTFIVTVSISLIIGSVLGLVLPAESSQLQVLEAQQSDASRSHVLSPGAMGTHPPSPTNLYCLVYEKNHRTGSTTVEKYLEKCLGNRPGIKRCLVHNKSTGYWTRCLQERQSNVHVMYSSDHLRLGDRDMISIMMACGELAVIRTSRPASERAFSRFKYNSCERGNCNDRDLNISNLNTSGRDSFWDWMQPYYSAVRFHPTRILENSKLDQELEVLGKELGCKLKVERANVHESKVSVEDAMGEVADGEVHRHNLYVKSWLKTKRTKLWRNLKGQGVGYFRKKGERMCRLLELCGKT